VCDIDREEGEEKERRVYYEAREDSERGRGEREMGILRGKEKMVREE